MPEKQDATWGELLRDAVEKPGRMLEAYTAFHNYSFGNALLALEQCVRRSLQPKNLRIIAREGQQTTFETKNVGRICCRYLENEVGDRQGAGVERILFSCNG